jgi:hypothetical protein
VENQVADPFRARGHASAARSGGSADLAGWLPEWLAEGQGLIEDIRTSLDTRYPAESQEELEAETPPLRGLLIALAAFVPTFLLVVIGLPYLVPLTPAPPGPLPAPMTMPPPSTTMLGPLSPVSTRLPAPLAELLETWVVHDTWATGLPGIASKPESVEPKPVGAADIASWTRAAAFADNRAASRLAGVMRSQGYRVDLRREDSATLPWVVWTSKSPVPSRSAN